MMGQEFIMGHYDDLRYEDERQKRIAHDTQVRNTINNLERASRDLPKNDKFKFEHQAVKVKLREALHWLNDMLYDK